MCPLPARSQGMWLQSKHCLPHSSQLSHENSRALVALGTVRGREDCVEVDTDHAITMFYRNQKCRNGRIEYEEFSPHTPPTWQPKCLVVLIAPDSRAALRDTLVEQGRILVHPLRIEVNYTTAMSENPDLEVASGNCALGRELLDLHRHDLAGQEERDRLVQLQKDLEQARVQSSLFDSIYQGLSAYRPPTSPPPPSSPPAPLATPPAGPAQVHPGQRNEELKEQVALLEILVAEAAQAISLCVPSETNICGRSSQRAPSPWISRTGEACAGNGTWEALEGTYCGYWGSFVNPDAAEAAEAAELLSLDGAPYCFNNDGVALKCSVGADRTNRAGIYELQEWIRPDRPYCKSDIFRELILDNTTATEADCRETIREKLDKCNHGTCPQCVSPCNYPVARTVGSVLKCMDMKKHFGFLHYMHTTDAGQLARSMHGARRKDNFIPVPEKLAAHLYHIAHYNPKGYVQRDAISCRKHHRQSPVAHFAPGFDDEGSPIARSGYMQTCSKHSDCLVCGRHPLTSQMHKCVKRFVLYDTVVTSNNGDIVFVNTTGGSSNAFDPDPGETAITGKHGICIDLDPSMNEGCSNQIAAGIKDGLIGCMDAAPAKLLCGLSVDIKHGDLSTVETSGNLFWPRVLLNGASDHDGDGQADPEMKCYDPIDCTQKCRYLERTARHGAGAPPTCAL